MDDITICYYICPECGFDWVNPGVENAPDTCPNCSCANVVAEQVDVAEAALAAGIHI